MSTPSTGFLAAIALLAVTAAAAPAGAQSVEVIAQGLNNPRGLGFGPDGYLYVAEAGIGGNGNCRFAPGPDGLPAEICYGETGALTRIDPSGVNAPIRVLSGLPSMANASGFATGSGPVDVQFFGANAFIVMGWGGDPAHRAGIGPKSHWFGSLLRASPSGVVFSVADISANEGLHNPAGGAVDTNPYGVLVLPGERIVADAAANALIISRSGDVARLNSDRTFVVLSPTAFGTEAVPTTVVRGPDGDIYVGQLSGAPFFRGSSTIWRVPTSGGSALPYLTGLTAVVDIAFAPDGTLYIVEIASGLVPGPGADPGVGNGRLLRKLPNAAPDVLVEGLVFPAGVAVGPDGALYLTNFGIFPGGGQVLRVTLD